MQLSSKDLESARVSDFGRRTVIPLTSIVLGAIVLVVTFVVITAQHQDRQALESSQRLAQTALKTKQQDVARNLKDYALWQDAFDNLHTKVNVEWAATDGNVGANIYNSLGYDKVFVLSPDRKTVYATEKGKPVTVDALEAIPTLRSLLPAAAQGGAASIAFLRSADETLIAGASAILPSNAADAPPPEARSIMIFIKAIDDKFLATMSKNYLLNDLRFTTGRFSRDVASLPLTSPDDTVLGNLTWKPERPGESVLSAVLPPLCVALLALFVFAVCVLQNARRSAEKIRDSARTIQAYALQLLNSSETRFRDVAEASSDWIWETDADLRFTFVSDRIRDVTGLDADMLVKTPLLDFFSTEAAPDGWSSLKAKTDQRVDFRDLRCVFEDRHGRSRIGRLAGRPILDGAGAFLGFRGTAADITVEVEAQERANHLALHDALTGLPNRVLLKERLNVALERVRREGIDVAVLCLDIDHFKDVNDSLGHSAGDILLQHLARRFGEMLRGMDTIARLGGDEFAIVQVDVKRIEEVEALARRLIMEFKKPFMIEGSEVYVGVSIGVALSPGDGMSQDELLKHADLALYRAKQAGRGTVRFFEPVMDSELQDRKLLEQDLRRALVKDELQVFYQPLVSVTDRELKGVEALLRWAHPVKGMIPPGEFIPLAEETGLIVPVGEWVLRTACEQAVGWPGLLIAVNVSAVQFRHGDFIDTVRRALQDTGLDPARLELEITEGVLLHDTEAAFATLTVLKDLGVRIAMDDFGTGYSSLGYLNSFAFDKIKIDRSFIDQVAQLDKSSAIVRSVISLGQSLNMITTAEGVETTEQLEFLRSEGCDEVQGYFFGRPMPAEEMNAAFRLGHREGASFTCGTGLLRTLASPDATRDGDAAVAPGTKPRGRSRSAVSADRRDIRDAATFAHRRGKTLNLLFSFRATGTGDVESAFERVGRIRLRIDDWFSRQTIDDRPLEAFAVWLAQGAPEPGAAWQHVMVHCPSRDIETKLRRAVRAWCRQSGELVAVTPLEWELDERTGKLRCLTANPISDRLEDRAALAFPGDGEDERWGVAAALDRDARAGWRARRALNMAARRSDAAFRRSVTARAPAEMSRSLEPADA